MPNPSLLRRPCLRLCALLFAAWLAGGVAFAQPASKEKRLEVLLLHSLEAGSTSSDRFEQGFVEGLGDYSQRIFLHTEFLDGARHPEDRENFSAWLVRKYTTRPPDVVIANGNQAFDLLPVVRRQWSSDAPLLFGNVSQRTDEEIARIGNLSGVHTSLDYALAYELIARMLPQTRSVYLYGRLLVPAAIRRMEQSLPAAQKLFEHAEWMAETDINKLEEHVRSLRPGSVVLLMGFLYDRGQVVPFGEVGRRLGAATAVPLFSMQEPYVPAPGGGVIGGVVASRRLQGRIVAERLRALVDGAPIASMPRQSKLERSYLFDYAALVRYGLQDVALPPESEVVNRPPRLRESSPAVFYGGLGVIATLLMLLLGTMWNLRARRHHAAELAHSEARYRMLFEDNPTPVVVYDIHSHAILALNAKLAELYRLTSGEAIGQRLDTFVPERLREAFNARLAASLAAGTAMQSAGIGQRADGSEFHYESWSRPITFGRHEARIAMVIDTSAREAAQAAEAAVRMRIDEIIMRMPVAMMVIDRNHVFTHWNRAAELLTGYAADVMVGQHDRALERQRDEPMLLDFVMDGRSLEEVQAATGLHVWRPALFADGLEFERQVEFKHTGTRWIHAVALPLHAPDGSVDGVVEIMFDTSEIHHSYDQLKAFNSKLEERVARRGAELEAAMEKLMQNEKLAALGRLVAGVAHELNTPLGNSRMVISALGESSDIFDAALRGGQLRRSDVDNFLAETRRASQLAEAGIMRAQALVEAFKLVATDRGSTPRTHFKLRDVIGQARFLLGEELADARLDIDVNVPETMTMESYAEALAQVLIQLLRNAAVHGLGELPSLQVRIAAEATWEGELRVVVSDDGVGMEEETARHAFEPFYTTRLGHGSSGLGLYLVHNLVANVLGGSVTLRSSPGTGTRVEMLLPLAAEHPVAIN